MTSTETPRPFVVVGVDSSPQSEVALRWAARFAKAEGADIRVVTAWEDPITYGWSIYPAYPDWDLQGDAAKATEATLDAVFGSDRPEGLTVRVVEAVPANALLEQGRDALLIVVGSRGRGGFKGMLLGSVSQAVAQHSKVPVLVVHGEDARTAQAAQPETAGAPDA